MSEGTVGDNKPVRFKTIRSKNAKFRKRNDELNKPDETTKDISAVLETTKEVQRQRARGKGLTAVAYQKEVILKPEASDSGGLDSQFTSQTEEIVEDLNMNRYVDEKLKERRGEKKMEKKISEEDLLYVTPEHLKVKRRDTSAAGGAVSGIVEVDLPVQYKLKNIEETEKATRRLQEKTRTQSINNENTNNFRGFDEEQRQNEEDDDEVVSKITFNEKATDEQAMERFKKKFKF